MELPACLLPRSSPREKQNLAARAGRWSAQHRKKAVFGWLAFVIAAVFIGGAIGTKTIPSDEEGVVGESARSAEIVKQSFPQTAGEQVLIQSKTGSAKDPEFKAAVKDVEKASPPRRTSPIFSRPTPRRTSARSRVTAAPS